MKANINAIFYSVINGHIDLYHFLQNYKILCVLTGEVTSCSSFSIWIIFKGCLWHQVYGKMKWKSFFKLLQGYCIEKTYKFDTIIQIEKT
jgi:hypothetical protein